MSRTIKYTKSVSTTRKSRKRSVTQDDIRIRAHQIHQQGGTGSALSDWLQAENELKDL